MTIEIGDFPALAAQVEAAKKAVEATAVKKDVENSFGTPEEDRRS